jgi:antitoxin VapB
LILAATLNRHSRDAKTADFQRKERLWPTRLVWMVLRVGNPHGPRLGRRAVLRYTDVYGISPRRPKTMPRTARVFMTNRSQAVRLPKEYQFSTDEVFIRKEGEDVILSPRPRDWRPYLESAPVASGSFMDNVEDLPVQERES